MKTKKGRKIQLLRLTKVERLDTFNVENNSRFRSALLEYHWHTEGGNNRPYIEVELRHTAGYLHPHVEVKCLNSSEVIKFASFRKAYNYIREYYRKVKINENNEIN